MYFWIENLKEGGYLVFHDTHSIAHSGEDNVIDEYTYGDTIGGVKVKRPDVAITDFFGLSESIRDKLSMKTTISRLNITNHLTV